jgi:hypothetical protein
MILCVKISNNFQLLMDDYELPFACPTAIFSSPLLVVWHPCMCLKFASCLYCLYYAQKSSIVQLVDAGVVACLGLQSLLAFSLYQAIAACHPRCVPPK